MTLAQSLYLALPELTVVVGAMLLLLYGVFNGDRSYRTVTWAGVLLLTAAGAVMAATAVPGVRQTGFNGLFIVDDYARFLKGLILLGSAAALMIAIATMERLRVARFEFPIVILLATVGMMMMVSANDLLSLYVGLELQSLSLYILASFHRDNARSTEAGLKYFVLGALSSGLLLYGVSLVYGFAGSTNFTALEGVLAAENMAGGGASVGLLFGLVFVLSGIIFKVAAVPFHMWTPDVYEGSPTPVTAFFAAAPKIAAMGLLVRLAMDAFPALTDQWRQIIIVASVGSMALGAVAAIVQTNIKRLLAYSSIGHVGYALLGLAAGTQAGVQSVLIYLAIYLPMTLGGFLCVMAMRRDGQAVETVADLAGLARHQPRLALGLATLMFSLAGIPLLFGFVAKLYVFNAAIAAGLYAPAVLGVLSSVVAAYYYLRVVKLMYFDAPAAPFDPLTDRPSIAVLAISTIVSSPLGYLLIGPLALAAGLAARALQG